MFSGNVEALHTQQLLKRKVLNMLEEGSVPLAAMFIWDEYQCMKKVNIFLEDCSDNIECDATIKELRDLIQNIGGDV